MWELHDQIELRSNPNHTTSKIISSSNLFLFCEPQFTHLYNVNEKRAYWIWLKWELIHRLLPREQWPREKSSNNCPSSGLVEFQHESSVSSFSWCSTLIKAWERDPETQSCMENGLPRSCYYQLVPRHPERPPPNSPPNSIDGRKK